MYTHNKSPSQDLLPWHTVVLVGAAQCFGGFCGIRQTVYLITAERQRFPQQYTKHCFLLDSTSLSVLGLVSVLSTKLTLVQYWQMENSTIILLRRCLLTLSQLSLSTYWLHENLGVVLHCACLLLHVFP